MTKKWIAVPFEVDNHGPCRRCPGRNKMSARCSVSPNKVYRNDGEDPTAPVDLVVIGDPPSLDDEKKGKYFSDEAAGVLLKHVKDLGFTSFAVVPSVRCYPGGEIDWYSSTSKYKREGTPVDKAQGYLEHCKAYVDRALRLWSPSMILSLGSFGAKSIGIDGAVANLRVQNPHPLPFTPVHRKENRGVIVTNDRFAVKRSFLHSLETFGKNNEKATVVGDVEKTRNFYDHGWTTPQARTDNATIHVADTIEKVKELINWLLTEKFDPDEVICFDFETQSLDLSKDTNRLLNVGFARRKDENVAYVIPLLHPETPFTSDEIEVVYALLKKLFRSEGASFYAWCAHHAQFEESMVKLFFDEWLGEAGGIPVLDAEILCYSNDEERRRRIGGGNGPFKLENLAMEMLGFTWYRRTGIKDKRSDLMSVPIDEVNEYVGVDSYVTARLFNVALERAAAEGSLDDLLRLNTKLYSEAIAYTTDMTWIGQKAEADLLKSLRDPETSEIQLRIQEIRKEFRAAPEVKQALSVVAGNSGKGKLKQLAKPAFSGAATSEPFSLTSPKHLRALFWDVMKLRGADKSLDDKFQEAHKDQHRLVALYSEHQSLVKLDSNYLQKIAYWLQSPNCSDGRLRPSFNLTNTNTGRLSASDPPTQTIPRGDTKDKKQIKALFCAEEGKVIVQLDFSQAEVRWLGIMSGDKNLADKYIQAEKLKDQLIKDPGNPEILKALKVDGDLHMSTALTMYKLPRDLPFKDPDTAKKRRQAAKAVCFGLIYGKSTKALARDLDISEDEAEEAVELWLGQFPDAAAWLEEQEEKAVRDEVITTPFGRWRRLPEVNSTDRGVIGRAKRQSRNSPIQATASDTTIYGACVFRRKLRNHPNPMLREQSCLTNSVHDSLLGEVPADFATVKEYCSLARSVFMDPDLLLKDFGQKITIPLAVDFEIGPNWGNVLDYDFTDESLRQILHDCGVLVNQPPGTIFKDLEGKGLLWNEKKAMAAA